MGMSTITSQLIMFIAVLTISTALVGVFNSQVDKTTSAISVQQDMLTNQLKTDIKIEMITYDSTNNNITAYIENTGSTSLDVNQIDLFVDGIYIPRDPNNRSISVISDTEIVNTGTFDPEEEIRVDIHILLPSSTTYKLTVTTQYAGMDQEQFST